MLTPHKTRVLSKLEAQVVGRSDGKRICLSISSNEQIPVGYGILIHKKAIITNPVSGFTQEKKNICKGV
jgi:hypothetical protein